MVVGGASMDCVLLEGGWDARRRDSMKVAEITCLERGVFEIDERLTQLNVGDRLTVG